jgi:hypothetical protein
MLRDIQDRNAMFGGIMTFLGGDFLQTMFLYCLAVKENLNGKDKTIALPRCYCRLQRVDPSKA